MILQLALVAVCIGLICALVYLFLRKRLSIESNYSNYYFSFCLTGVFIAFMWAIFIYISRTDEYVKPLGYYILSAIAVIFCFLGAMTSKTKLQTCLLLFFICAIGLSHIWTENMMFRSLIGIDPWTHYVTITQDLATEKTLGTPLLTILFMGYSLMHVFISWIMSLGLDYKMALLIFWGSVQVVGNIVFVYLIGKELLNKKVGLIAALMVANANWAIFFGEWIIPNGIGATLSLVVAYLFIKAYKSKKQWVAWLSLLVLPVAFFTHILVAAWVIGTIVCMILITLTLDFIKTRRVNYLFILPVVVVLSFVVWHNFSYMNTATLTTIANIADTPSFGNGGHSIVNPTTDITAIPSTAIPNAVESPTIAPNTQVVPIVRDVLNRGNLGELVINSIGMFLYIGIAIIGLIMMPRYSNLNKAWVILCMGTLALSSVPSLFGYFALKERWWYLAEVFMAIPLAVALMGLVTINKRGLSLCIVACLLGIVSFFSTIGLPSNLTNRTLSENQIVRYAFTDKELEGLQVAGKYDFKYLGADPIYTLYIMADARYKGRYISLENYILKGDFSNCMADVLLLRDAIYKEPFGYGSGSIYRVDYNVVELAKQQGYKEVWSNEEIHCLVRK